jgi:hypothetical protein
LRLDNAATTTAVAAVAPAAACLGLANTHHNSISTRLPTPEDPQLGWSFGHGVSITRYASGMGFIMTHDMAQCISDNAAVLYKGYPEDAVVGLWLAGTSLQVQHDARLHDWEWKRCSDQSIIIHKHDYGVVDDDGVMRSCFPVNITVTEASSHHHPDGSSDGEMPPVS